ncbi:MAG: glycerol-3-phosphate 1-O-acyltransferase PlsY [Acidimicrobiia bacterium]
MDRTVTVGAVAAAVLGYLVGSIDFAVLVARAQGKDIYEMGSGNPGAANVLRNLGWKAALPVMLGDVAKGAAAAAVGTWLGGSELAGWAAGFAAVVGHCFPVWHRFHGGKGVSTALGVVLWLEPILGLVLIGIWAGLLALTKVSSLGSLAAMAALVPGLVVAGARGAPLLWATAIAVLVVIRHQANIAGLLARRERTV